jgi:hypothetical protein
MRLRIGHISRCCFYEVFFHSLYPCLGQHPKADILVSRLDNAYPP